MKIIVDVMGGDKPQEVIKGAIDSLFLSKDFSIILVGNEELITATLSTLKYDSARVEILPSTEDISCSDEPTVAIRKKTESSLIKSYDLLKREEEVVGLISAGSTGAVLTGGFMKIGRLKGVSRPALAPALPTLTGGKVLLIDSGANVDCKPINLCHFALLGSAYYRAAFGVERPRVALLSNGTEKEKGNALVKAAYPLMEQMDINFVGNMDARDVLSGKYDVIVADGFAGNVALKATEGGVVTLLKMLKSGIKSSFRAKIGYLFLKPVFTELRKTMDINGQGGAVLLGLKKPVVKVHGSATASAVTIAVSQITTLANFGYNDKLTEALSSLPEGFGAESAV